MEIEKNFRDSVHDLVQDEYLRNCFTSFTSLFGQLRARDIGIARLCLKNGISENAINLRLMLEEKEIDDFYRDVFTDPNLAEKNSCYANSSSEKLVQISELEESGYYEKIRSFANYDRD